LKKKLVLRTMVFLILMASMFILSSCSRTAKESLTKEQKEQQDNNIEAASIEDNDFAEADEDLMTVDYKEFYDQLAPHGEWIQVQPEEVGLKSKLTSYRSSGNNDFSISNLFGVNDAYADANVGMVFVWKPSSDLAVSTTLGDVSVVQSPLVQTPVYVPYTNGQWVNTDAGWYFKAPTPVEETVSHYGRWVNSPTAGWLWVPGRVWAPAWVDWKQNDDYVSWAPLPPSVYINNGTMSAPIIDDNNYLIVNRKYFLEPTVYRYNNVYYDNGNTILLSDMKRTDGIVVYNNTIINRGPDVNIIQTIYGRNIDLVKIQHVRNFNEIRYSDREYFVYRPDFKKYKSKDNKYFKLNEPKSYKKYDDWKVRKNEEKEYKKEEKEIRKENKQVEKEINKGNKHESYNNGKKNKGNENVKKNSGNENVKKNSSNENVKKNSGNENVKKQKNSEKTNKQKNNNNEKKQNTNSKGKEKK
jgi:hypothetical protein